MGKDAIISGGSEQNIFRILDRGTLNVSGGICTKYDTNCNCCTLCYRVKAPLIDHDSLNRICLRFSVSVSVETCPYPEVSGVPESLLYLPR